MSKKPARIVAPPEYDLPANFSREIGRIVVRWAYFEHAVRRLVWDVLGVDDKIGRIAVRDPRIDDRIEMLGDIAFLKKISIDASSLASLKAKANEVLRWRDLVSHGLWIPTSEGWLLQMIGGSYPKSYEAEHPKRRVNPEGINVSLEGLRSVVYATEILIGDVLTLRKVLAERLPPSPDTRRER
jgi:hypothetical protein